jgi:excisionase family DNA binding protein
MKRARPPLAPQDRDEPGALLTTADVARLLRVHPKHVYRLLRRGLPGHRVGGEWRFAADEVRVWSGLPKVASPSPPPPSPGVSHDLRSPPDLRPTDPRAHAAPPLLAANGDLAVESLLAHLRGSAGPLLGFVQADRGEALALLERGDVLCAGYHGDAFPEALEDQRLAFIHLVDREVGLALRRGVRLRSLRGITRLRVASRPETAGVRAPFDAELRRQGIDPASLHARAIVLRSHEEVVCAVARGEADVGVASVAWASRVGLDWMPLCRERYGLLVRAAQLGDPRVVRLCEIAQSGAFRREVGGVAGYGVRSTGAIAYASHASRVARGGERGPGAGAS